MGLWQRRPTATKLKNAMEIFKKSELMTPEERQNWAIELMACRRGDDEDACDRFAGLIEAGRGGTEAEARILLATIMDEPEDVGQGEAVLSLLRTFPAEAQARAIISELPRLEAEGYSSWAESIVETESRFRPEELIRAAEHVSSHQRAVLSAVLQRISTHEAIRGATDPVAGVLRSLGRLKDRRGEG